MGSMVTYVALPYQVYRLTESSFAWAAGVAELVPLLVTAFIGGRSRTGWTAGASSLPPISPRHRLRLPDRQRAPAPPHVWPLFLVAGLMSGLSGLQRPSLEAITPRLVDKDELPAAAALATLRGSVGMIAGPAIGGILIASAGLASTYVADLLTYAFSFVPSASSASCRRRRGRRAPASHACARASGTRAAGRS